MLKISKKAFVSILDNIEVLKDSAVKTTKEDAINVLQNIADDISANNDACVIADTIKNI